MAQESSKTPSRITRPVLSRLTFNRAVGQLVDESGQPSPTFEKAILAAMGAQQPLVMANLRRIYRRNPDATPADIANILSRDYMRVLTTTGAAAGGTAIIPGVGTTVAIGTSMAASVLFLQITSFYAQSLAELYGFQTRTDREAQALVMLLMLGEDGRQTLIKAGVNANTALGSLGGASFLVTSLSGLTERAFAALQRRFLTSFGTEQVSKFAGRIVPFGFGIVMGGVGNRKLGQEVTRSAQKFLGPLPAWSEIEEVRRNLESKETAEEKRARKATQKQLEQLKTALAEAEEAKEAEDSQPDNQSRKLTKRPAKKAEKAKKKERAFAEGIPPLR